MFIGKMLLCEGHNIEQKTFKFWHYSRQGLNDFFVKTFPINTPKEFVDAILIDNGGVKSKPIRQHILQYNIIRYDDVASVANWYGSVHIFIFNRQNKLVNIHPFGGGKLFKDMPGLNEIESPEPEK